MAKQQQTKDPVRQDELATSSKVSRSIATG